MEARASRPPPHRTGGLAPIPPPVPLPLGALRPWNPSLRGEPLWGLLLLAGWGASLFLPQPFRPVFRSFDLAARFGDSGYLVAASFWLVFLNTCAAWMLYLGWFLLGDHLSRSPGRSPRWGQALPLLAIPLCLQAASLLEHRAALQTGVSFLLGTCSVWLVAWLTESVPRWPHKALALGLLLGSFQWLDVIPALTSFGFGQGELAGTLKTLAVVLGRAEVLDVAGSVAFLGVFAGGLVTTGLLVAGDRQMRQQQRIARQERELARLREERIRTRGLLELQRLVHDLKRPLTSVLGLADLLRQGAPDRACRDHGEVIFHSASTMNDLVSEILNPRWRRRITAGEVLDYTRSQVSPLPWWPLLRVEAEEEDLRAPLDLNLVRFSRALVNLLDNGARAVERGGGAVELRLRRTSDRLEFRVRDDGPGFREEPRPGRSTWGSTGLGLPFVEDVAEEHGGTLSVRREGTWTEVALSLPLVAGLRGPEEEGTR